MISYVMHKAFLNSKPPPPHPLLNQFLIYTWISSHGKTVPNLKNKKYQKGQSYSWSCLFMYFLEVKILKLGSIRLWLEALFVILEFWELYYRFQTFHDNFRSTKVQVENCSNYVIIIRKSVSQFETKWFLW